MMQLNFCRFCDHWHFVSQQFASLGAFIVYMESDQLITRPDLAEIMLGGKVKSVFVIAMFNERGAFQTQS